MILDELFLALFPEIGEAEAAAADADQNKTSPPK